MDDGNINKIWGTRRRILLTDKTEIDLIEVKKDCYCSTHSHREKVNRFFVISGKLKIETDYGTKVLYPNESWDVYPPRVHRFYAVEDSVVVELAFINGDKTINPTDIDRRSQGGRVINGKEYTLNEMEEKGMLDL